MACATPRLYAPAPDPVQDQKDDAHDRLKLLVEEDYLTGCHVFVGVWDRHGNGQIRVAGRKYTAHRVSAWVYLGGFELPDPEVRVEHACRGCPACVNPDHLRVVRRAQAGRAAA